MYALFLFVHSLVRWIVLALGFLVVARAIRGLSGRRTWEPADDAGVSRFARAFETRFRSVATQMSSSCPLILVK